MEHNFLEKWNDIDVKPWVPVPKISSDYHVTNSEPGKQEKVEERENIYNAEVFESVISHAETELYTVTEVVTTF